MTTALAPAQRPELNRLHVVWRNSGHSLKRILGDLPWRQRARIACQRRRPLAATVMHVRAYSAFVPRARRFNHRPASTWPRAMTLSLVSAQV